MTGIKGSIIPMWTECQPPLKANLQFFAESEGAEPEPAPASEPASAAPSIGGQQDSEPAPASEKITTFKDINRDALYKVLGGEKPAGENQDGKSDVGTEGQKQEGTEPPKKSDHQAPAQDVFASTLEEIKKINPKAAEKYKSPEAVAKTLINQEKTITGLFQTKAQLETQLNNLNAEMERLKNAQAHGELPENQQPPQNAEKGKKAELAPEEKARKNEELLAKMMENPLEFVEELKSEFIEEGKKQALEEVNKVYGPFIEAYNSELTMKSATAIIDNFRNAVDESGNLKYPEFDKYSEEMGEVLKTFPQLKEDPNKLMDALDFAYRSVNGKYANEKKDPEELLKDEKFLREKVLTNEDVKKLVIEGYLKEINEGKPPVVISNQPGGSSVAQPPEKPKSYKDATKIAKKFFGLS